MPTETKTPPSATVAGYEVGSITDHNRNTAARLSGPARMSPAITSAALGSKPASTSPASYNTATGPGAGIGVTGNNNTASGTNAGSGATGDHNTAIGDEAGRDIYGNYTIALGYGSGSNIGTLATPVYNTISIGTSATASADNATALGTNSSAAHANSAAIGPGATTTVADQIMLGSRLDAGLHAGRHGHRRRPTKSSPSTPLATSPRRRLLPHSPTAATERASTRTCAVTARSPQAIGRPLWATWPKRL